jgi:hypothetical protein
MRKHALLLAALLLLVPGVAGAMVIEPGTIEVSGASQLTYSSMTFKNGSESDTTSMSLDLLGNYYFLPNLGAGIFMGYGRTEIDDQEETSLSLGPIVKYQFPLAEQINLFAIGTAGYQKYEFTDNSEADGWYGSVGGGLSYFLSSSFSIDALLRYEYDSLDADGGDLTVDGFLFGLGVSVFLR